MLCVSATLPNNFQTIQWMLRINVQMEHGVLHIYLVYIKCIRGIFVAFRSKLSPRWPKLRLHFNYHSKSNGISFIRFICRMHCNLTSSSIIAPSQLLLFFKGAIFSWMWFRVDFFQLSSKHDWTFCLIASRHGLKIDCLQVIFQSIETTFQFPFFTHSFVLSHSFWTYYIMPTSAIDHATTTASAEHYQQ